MRLFLKMVLNHFVLQLPSSELWHQHIYHISCFFTRGILLRMKNMLLLLKPQFYYLSLSQVVQARPNIIMRQMGSSCSTPAKEPIMILAPHQKLVHRAYVRHWKVLVPAKLWISWMLWNPQFGIMKDQGFKEFQGIYTMFAQIWGPVFNLYM